MARLIAARGAREVVGIDTSSSLINAAATHEDVGSLSISHYVASLESIPEKDATFDTVVCNHVLSDVTNPETALREIGRVLRPSGRFVALMLHPCFYTAHSERDSRGNIPVRSYLQERPVDQTFVVAGHESPDEVHMNFRPLEFYSRAIDAGFVITGLSEPHPSEEVLDAAVVSAAPEVGVEALEGVRPHPTDRDTTDGRPHVLLDLAHVAGSSLAVNVDDLEPSVEEVVHRCLGARATALVDLVEQPVRIFSASRSVSRRVARAGTVSPNQSFSPLSWSIPA